MSRLARSRKRVLSPAKVSSWLDFGGDSGDSGDSGASCSSCSSCSSLQFVQRHLRRAKQMFQTPVPSFEVRRGSAVAAEPVALVRLGGYPLGGGSGYAETVGISRLAGAPPRRVDRGPSWSPYRRHRVRLPATPVIECTETGLRRGPGPSSYPVV